MVRAGKPRTQASTMCCLLFTTHTQPCPRAAQVVAPTWRRRGAAAALLAAAEAAVELWDERQAVLHVYQDNIAAVQASQAGLLAGLPLLST